MTVLIYTNVDVCCSKQFMHDKISDTSNFHSKVCSNYGAQVGKKQALFWPSLYFLQTC
jgi:hypothetical protein